MKEFLKYLHHDIKKSRLSPHVLDLQRFVTVDENTVYVNITYLDISYIDRFISPSLRSWSDGFMNFSIRAMAYQQDTTLFRFAFNWHGVSYFDFDLNDYRRHLVEMINEKFPKMRPKLLANNRIGLLSEDINDGNKYEFPTRFTPLIRELNTQKNKVPTAFDVFSNSGLLMYTFILN